MDKYKILKIDNINLPIFLESTIDDLGVMVDFDNYITEINNIYNFTYIINNKKVRIYINGKYEALINQVFTVLWGDNNKSDILLDFIGDDLPYVEHTYELYDNYEIEILFNSPWNNNKLVKNITLPQDVTIPNLLGTLSGIKIPYTEISGITQDYLFKNEVPNETIVSYMVMCKSRINENKLYGQNTYSGITLYNNNISGYTFDGILYKDYPDGLSIMEVNTSGFTREEILNRAITRNEHFIGFIDTPQIFSDIFVERGKQSITESNFKLCELDSIGKLSTSFNIEKY